MLIFCKGRLEKKLPHHYIFLNIETHLISIFVNFLLAHADGSNSTKYVGLILPLPKLNCVCELQNKGNRRFTSLSYQYDCHRLHCKDPIIWQEKCQKLLQPIVFTCHQNPHTHTHTLIKSVWVCVYVCVCVSLLELLKLCVSKELWRNWPLSNKFVQFQLNGGNRFTQILTKIIKDDRVQ